MKDAQWPSVLRLIQENITDLGKMTKESQESNRKNTGVRRGGVRGHGEPDFRQTFILV